MPKDVPIPPSLRNIYLELKSNYLNYSIPKQGSLNHWSSQGVFLLNTVLTVEQNKPGSHFNIGWERFTNKVIELINYYHTEVIFLLWGKHAQNKKNIINKNNHFILETSHPSPFSVNKGFFGCRHFLIVNKILTSKGKKNISWC